MPADAETETPSAADGAIPAAATSPAPAEDFSAALAAPGGDWNLHPSNNGPKTPNFVTSARGEKLHVRLFLPSDSSIKAVVFYLHGYGGHGNTVPKLRLGKFLSEKGFAVVMPDLIGHGYSEGMRSYCTKWTDWLDDQRLVVQSVCGGAAAETAETAETAPKVHLEMTAEQRAACARLPFFLAGESLGGAHCIALGLRLQEEAAAAGGGGEAAVAKRFSGVCLVAPAIKGNPPPAPVVAVLRYLVAPLVPTREIPKALDSVFLPDKTWTRKEDEEGLLADSWGVTPQSLGWGKQIRFRMGVCMLDLAAHVEKSLASVRFPFLSLHDPGDAIVQFEGTQMLSDKASTPDDGARSCEVARLNGCLHDLLTNCNALICERIVDWVDARLAATAVAATAAAAEPADAAQVVPEVAK